ncbi:Crp/Fnr family transcriptional regulator [Chitinophaga rhizophila]|uniref:Crp/Fnr family transcriptional regulator n=1 Tax=Chitinophaga rhizophila TaxID=2866212 RepID=A0ABS7GIS5_9BACT|nr:Crp/Fnr family transcriptional regulator [Chitinophaga rhizophila]MBW8687050.1 Crp/Fnr family transcriptional regulator [Chitinophaga rhizophila]
MYDVYFGRFNEKVILTDEEMEIIKAHLVPKTLRKKEVLLHEGEICRQIAFVEKGALRMYLQEESGHQRITQFAVEGWTISDLFSFLTGEPATQTIDALEDTTVLLMSKDAHEALLKQMGKYETYVRMLITNAYIALQKRFTASFRLPLEEQYQQFVGTYPQIANRVPQHMIASYMGLTPATLSRLRRRIALRKQ